MREIPFVVHSSGYVVSPDKAKGYDCGGEGGVAEKTKTQSKQHKGNSPSALFSKVRYSACNTLHFSYVAMTRTQNRGGVRGIDGNAKSNASRPSRALTRSQKELKDQAGEKGIVLLPSLFNAHPPPCVSVRRGDRNRV